MELIRIQGEFESVELAELAAGRVRRSVSGVKRTIIQPLGRTAEPDTGKYRYTLLPANPRMQNYATAVMLSEISDDILPEPVYRKSAKLLVLCSRETAGRAAAIIHAMGAVKVQDSTK